MGFFRLSDTNSLDLEATIEYSFYRVGNGICFNEVSDDDAFFSFFRFFDFSVRKPLQIVFFNSFLSNQSKNTADTDN
jgi:hypothetical protein